MSAARDIRHAAAVLGGEVVGRDSIACPGPGHSPRDRSLSIRIIAGDEFVCHSHAGDDWQLCRDHVKARLGWTDKLAQVGPVSRRRPPEADLTAKQLSKARWLWSRRRPIEGTPAERYLRDARGYSGTIPGNARLRAGGWHLSARADRSVRCPDRAGARDHFFPHGTFGGDRAALPKPDIPLRPWRAMMD